MKDPGYYHFTHAYKVTGHGRRDTSYLVPITSDTADDGNSILVSLSILPNIYLDRIPDEPLERAGDAGSCLIKLWTDASGLGERFYCKEDWERLDSALFYSPRRNEAKAAIRETFLRLWAVSQEAIYPYDITTWFKLYRYIQPAE